MLVRDREKAQIDANTLSVRLLKSIGGSTMDERSGPKGAMTLQGLSNRIKLANQTHKNTQQERETVKEELLDEGIDLEKDKLHALQTKQIRRERTIVHKPVKEQQVGLQPSCKDLSYEQLAHKTEQNLAYRGIFQTLTVQEYIRDPAAESRLQQLRRKNFNLIRYQQREPAPLQKLPSQASEGRGQLGDVVRKFGRCVSEVGIEEVHQHLYRQFKEGRSAGERVSGRWMLVLMYQIEMAGRVCVREGSGGWKDVKNYMATVSIEALDNIFAETYGTKFQYFHQSYFQGQNREQEGIKRWSELYFLLRSGQKQQFLDQLKEKDNSLGNEFQIILNKISQFQSPQLHFNDVGVNQSCVHFQRLFKLIVMGKFQNIFKSLRPKTRALQQPWFILMSLGFTARQETERKRNLKQATADYYQSLINQILYKSQDQSNLDYQLILNFMTGLISLGNFNLLLRFYDQLSQRSCLQDNAFYIDFVHVFILTAANPSLLYAHLSEVDAQQTLRRCVQQIVIYLKYLKTKPSFAKEFKIYFTLLLRVLTRIGNQLQKFPYQQLIEMICSDLMTNLQDLHLVNTKDLEGLAESSGVVKKFQSEVIKNIHPKDELQFIQLAEFCDSIYQPQLQEYILVKLILFNYFQVERDAQQIQSDMFDQNRQLQPALSRNVKMAESYLERTMSYQRRWVLQFLKDLKDLREFVNYRRTDLLRREERRFAKYRSSNERIFGYLIEMDNTCKSGYFDIFVLYYEKLFWMYNLIHISTSSLDRFQKERTTLLTELQKVKERYPEIEGLAYSRTVELLSR